MAEPVIRVDGGSERWLRRGFPWVYPNEITRGGAAPGAEVLVRAADGRVLGRGLFDRGWIAVRVFRHDEGPLDEGWLHEVLEAAWALRARVIDRGTTGYRLVNAENDGLPGVRVDWWDGHAVLALDSPSLAALVPRVAAWLIERGAASVHLCYRPDPRETLDLSRVQPPPGLVAGEAPAGPVEVRERGIRFLVEPSQGPDVGLYADMREVRAWLEPHWRGRRVLNTFAYTGAFSVAALLRGAREVVSVDLSEPVLDRLRANLGRNGLGDPPSEELAADVFKALDRFRRKDERFDLVILDPPAYSRGPHGDWSAARDLPRLVAAASRVLEVDGWLLVASNQGELSPRKFRGAVEDGLARASRRAQEIWWGGQGPDFPAASWFPEGRYLKVGVWRLL